MKPFTDDDFPITAQGHNVYRHTESGAICTCWHQSMAAEIAKRLNRDHDADKQRGDIDAKG